MNLLKSFKAHFGIGILVIAFTLALVRVLTLQGQTELSDRTVIRICHWQMESGVREALDEIAREYEQIHPDIRIEQIIIGERGYLSWLTTRLIGGSAPDIVAVPDPNLYQRHFLPLSEEIEKPNPYNVGTPMEGISWKETYYDNMDGGFVVNLLDYYAVPASAFTIRLFYNKALYQAATGMQKPPKDFQSFIKACEKITKYGQDTGRNLIPIAAAGRYNARPLWERFDTSVASTLAQVADVNFDGEVSDAESIIALTSGRIAFDDPRIEAMFKGRTYYNHQFQPGFFAADRTDAAFLFLQQKAVMIASGAWDAGSYVKQADFEIGIADFPLPGPDDPEFGRFVEAPAAEEMIGSFSFSVNRMSAHRAQALDFLQFLSSQKMNDKLNRRTKWIPMVRGNSPDPFIAPFWPRIDGVRPGLLIESGDQNKVNFAGLNNLFATGRLPFREFLDRYAAPYLKNSDQALRTDVPRKVRLELAQSEFSKTFERTTAQLKGIPTERDAILLEGQLSRRHEMLENASRYEDARQQSPLPQP